MSGSSGEPRPVPFEATTEGGLSADAQLQAAETNTTLPRAEAFYTQYQYPVGYVGIPFLLNDLHRSARTAEFGQLTTVYVTDFSGTGVALNENGTLVMSSAETTDWVTGEEAYFVMNSSAETVGRTPAIVPFSNATEARRFARQYGGSVERWQSVRQRRYDGIERTEEDWQRIVADRQAWADIAVDRAQRLASRPVSIVVESGEEPLQAAVDRAPSNTTVRLRPGRYDVDGLRIDKPITIRGAGQASTVVNGDGDGSVFNVTASRVGITDLKVTGVGTEMDIGPIFDSEDASRRYHGTYGRGAAGVVFNRAPRSYVSNVTVSTPSSGILVRHSSRTVVSETTVYAPPNTQNNSRAISVVDSSRTVIQDSELWGGFHSLMAVDMRGIVVRNIHAEGAVTGFHSLYTGRALVSNSTFRDMFKPVMSALESYANAAVSNDIRNSAIGVDFAGSRSYVARNTLVHNRVGLFIERRATLYTGNVIGYNYAGVQVGDAFPTNRVTSNDFVGNDRHAWIQSRNVLFVWGESGHGNYWSGAPWLDRDGDGYLDRYVAPDSPAGRLSYRTAGGDTISRSPAVGLLRSLRQAVPGLRSDGVIDTSPLAAPNRPRMVVALRRNYSAVGPYRPASDPDPYDYHARYDVPRSENDTFG